MKFFLNNYFELNTFPDDTIKAMLVHGYIYDIEHRYVVDVSDNELEDESYSRVQLFDLSRVINNVSGSISFSAENPNFGYIENSTLDGLVIYKQNTTDLDSPLLFFWPLPEQFLDGSVPYEIFFDPAGIMTIASGA